MNEEKIYKRLLEAFGNPIGVCALMGNLKAESNLNPINVQNSFEKKLGMDDATYTAAVDYGVYGHFTTDGVGYGLAQWTYKTRKADLYNFAKKQYKSIGDLDMQIDFLINEITAYKNVFGTILTGSDLRTVSDVIMTQYERPADQSEAAKKKRADYGYEFYRTFVTHTPENHGVYFQKPIYNGSSIVEALYSIGENFSFEYRKKVAEANGITRYVGNAAQNTKMLNMLKNGVLKRV